LIGKRRWFYACRAAVNDRSQDQLEKWLAAPQAIPEGKMIDFLGTAASCESAGWVARAHLKCALVALESSVLAPGDPVPSASLGAARESLAEITPPDCRIPLSI